MDVSIVIPAHNEAGYLGACLDSIRVAESAVAPLRVEAVVVLNRCTDETEAVARAKGARCVTFDEPCIAAVRNHGIRASSGDLVLTIDADSRMHPDTLKRALECHRSGGAVGGDTGTLPERWSLGTVLSVLSMAPYLAGRGISGGSFWFPRESFEAIGGFDEDLLSVEDLDFGIRLKAHGKRRGLGYRRLRGCHVVTSCRKFDQFGDWYLLRNPGLVRRIFKGKDREATDKFYYRTGRK